MAVFAGIHSLKRDRTIPPEFGAALRASVSRVPGDGVSEFRDGPTIAYALDLGAFGGDFSITDENGGFAVVAGETLSQERIDSPDRGLDLADIHSQIGDGRTDLLKRCRGTFCAVSSQNGSLSLVADRLGIRQLFYWIGPEFIVFATALRILENLDFVPRRLNVRGVIEQAALGYPLGDRTPYENVFAMRAGEIIQFRGDRTLRCRYWKWDETKPSELPRDTLLDRLHESFHDATRIRMQNETGAIAYLSGGLDSRCVVAALCGLGARPHTFNFARPGTQDLVLGAEFAARVDVIHNEIPKEAGDHVPDYSAMIADAWKSSGRSDLQAVERPGIAWSGEGGSVALGHVHLGRKIVDLMRHGRVDEAIDVFFEREGIHLSRRMFRSGRIDRPLEIVRQGIREELAQFAACDSARNFYLFLMLNDQRRKLHRHFEEIDRHRMEFQLPFFDSEFFRTILEIPVDECIEHRAYVRWLYHFQPAVTEVAWQSYPGHEPCPIPVPKDLAYQWDGRYQSREQKALARRFRAEARELLRSKHFPSHLLSRSGIRLAYLLHRTGLRDYSYIIDTSRLIERYHRNCA